MRIGIALSEYHFADITGKMLELAQEVAASEGASVTVQRVQGSFELPYAAKLLLDQGCDGVVAIGAILKGETAHDEVIGSAIANALAQLSITYGKPVMLGVQGPRMSREQAIERIPRTKEVMHSCIKLVREQQTTKSG